MGDGEVDNWWSSRRKSWRRRSRNFVLSVESPTPASSAAHRNCWKQLTCPDIVRAPHETRTTTDRLVLAPTHARLPLPVLLVRLAIDSSLQPPSIARWPRTCASPVASCELHAHSLLCLGLECQSRSLHRSTGSITLSISASSCVEGVGIKFIMYTKIIIKGRRRRMPSSGSIPYASNAFNAQCYQRSSAPCAQSILDAP
jgi:hypothetical protein